MLNIQSGTISLCHKYLDKIGKINQQNVQSLPIEIKEFLHEVTPKRLEELAQMNCYAASKIKSELDLQFGENNYVLIAIGRSISSIAELMKKMGVDSKIIPLSGLRHYDIEKISSKDLEIYKKFLAQIGLSKSDLKNNKDKTYVLMDYTYYGRSLTSAEKLLKKEELLGNIPNLISMPVSEALGNDYYKKGFKLLFEYCRFKDYSYVGTLPANSLKDVFEKYCPEKIKELKGNITQGLRKLFWFNVFDSINKDNNIIPKKELDAVFEHNCSNKAIKNFIKREQRKIQNIQ